MKKSNAKPIINFDGEKKTRIEWGNMTQSCKKCGFFVSNSVSSAKDSYKRRSKHVREKILL
jgi:hypothetical protein